MSWNYRIEEEVLHVIFNRPERHNAFYDQMIAELKDFFTKELPRLTARVCVLRAEGKTFSAGADLNWMKKMGEFTFEENLKDARNLAELVESLFTSPIPTIARVQGSAFGGGVGLIAACDFAFGLRNCRFGFTEVRLGLAPACISRPVILRLGSQRARQLFLTGEIFSAEKACQMGLLDRIFETEEEMDKAIQDLVKQLRDGGKMAQRVCKELTDKVPGLSRQNLLEYVARTLAELRGGEEAKEGVAAFLEKREPRWRAEKSS